MKVVCAPDSFKESMTAQQAAAAMARGVRRVVPDATIDEVPMSDGGEGFLAALTAAVGADRHTVTVPDALGRPIEAGFALSGDLAVLEVAQAVGLEDVAPAERDIWASSTVGVGRLLSAALDAGARRIVVGLGGTVTNDGGAGMLDALGVRYLDAEGARLRPTPGDLIRVAVVDTSSLDPRIAGVTIDAACDVTNPLTGPSGASAVFGPQKGATPQDVPRLDALLARLAEVDGTAASATQSGAGAAGGLGHAFRAHLGARLRPGVDLVTETVGLAVRVRDADLVLTGEGSVDSQTLSGKTPAGVAAVGEAAGVPTVVLAGRVAADADVLLEAGVCALVPILPEAMDLPAALARGADNLERATATVLRLFTTGARGVRPPRDL